MNILNKEELKDWLFEHEKILCHVCYGIKGNIQTTAQSVNIAYVDSETGERIEIIYA